MPVKSHSKSGRRVKATAKVRARKPVRRKKTVTAPAADTDFSTFVETCPQMVFVAIPSLILYVNRAFQTLMGYSKEDLCSSDFDFLSLFAPESRKDASLTLERVNKGENAGGFVELHMMNEEGRLFNAQVGLRRIRYHGKTAVLGIVSDLTERRNLEAQLKKDRAHLKETEARYRELFLNAPIGIYRTHPDGHVLMANPAIVNMLGYDSFEDLSHVNIGPDTYHPSSPRARFIDQIEAHGSVCNFEATWIKKDGTPLYVRESAKAIRDPAGKTLYYEGTIEDITAQRRARDILDRQIDFEKLVTTIAIVFVNTDASDTDVCITNSIHQLAEFLDLDRATVLQFPHAPGAGISRCIWLRSGMPPLPTPRSGDSRDEFKWIEKELKSGKIINLRTLADLPPEAASEQTILSGQGVKSVLAVPLACGASVIGFLIFDAIRHETSFDETTISMIRIVGEILASAIQRKNEEDELRYRLHFEDLITSTSTKFVGLSPMRVDQAISQALKDLGEFCNVQHSYVYLFSEDGSTATRTHVWQKDPSKPLWDPSGIIPCNMLPAGIRNLLDGEVLYIPRLDALPSHMNEERLFLERFGFKSVVCVPFRSGNDRGFLGFTSESEGTLWQKDIVFLLKIVGEIFASALELKKTSLALQKERYLFRALMDHIPDHIYFKDRESRFINANRAMMEGHDLKGLRDLVGKSDFDLFADPHASQAFEDEQTIMQTGRPMIGKEEREAWQDGSVSWASTTKLPLYDEEGRIIGTFGVSRDITDRKKEEEERGRLEAQMQHTQKLESLGILSGGIAHDFNNLLMGILGNTGLALMQLTPDSPVWSHIKQIETVALRAAELTNQMLAYSGKSKFIVKPLNLTSLVREMAHLLEVSISKRVKLDYSFVDKLPLMDGDAAQIRQVVMNLITNASDAIGDQKGSISVATGEMDLSSDYLAACYIAENATPGRHVFVEVTDTGCGMNARTQERIFDPFFTTKVKGRGLGLAAVLGIVRSHRGTLRVYSEVGKGTDFKVFFPCSSSLAVVEEPPVHSSQHWKGSGTILVVDDDDIIRAVTEQILCKYAFTVLTAGDANAAIRIAREAQNRFAAILLDVTLPEITGAEALTALRQILGATPIILMSGYNEQTATADMPVVSFNGCFK